jgi:Tfp pilus assembly PilM family ATPase
MFAFSTEKSRLGIEITSGTVRVAVVSGRGANTTILSTTETGLPAGGGSYSLPNGRDCDQVRDALRSCCRGFISESRRAALCLPDGVFRIQTLEFDELPGKTADRERLIRWRLEKTAAFDVSDTLVRYHILRRRNSGFTILACMAKKQVIEQYETLLLELGLEPWSVTLSSLTTLNFYAPAMVKKSSSFALTHVTEDSFATIVSENGGVRFYRFKEIKRATGQDIHARLLSEIADSLHFYLHQDRSQQAEVGRLYLCGAPVVRDALAGELRAETTLEVEVLSPEIMLPAASRAGSEMETALAAAAAI